MGRHTRIALNKTDYEHAMKASAARVKDIRSHPAVIEESPEYDPPSNGVAERCVQTVKRVIQGGEERIGDPI